jgi:hypothetical protein
MDNLSTGWTITLLLAGFCLFMAVVVCLGFMLSSAVCTAQASRMQLEYSWGPLQDCMVKVDGKWTPMRRYILLGN